MTDTFDLGHLIAHMNDERVREEDKLLGECKEVWASGRMLPDHLLRRVASSTPKGFRNIQAAHPARRIHQDIENIRTAYAVLQSARDAILAVYGNFHAQMVHSTDRANQEGTLLQATREVFTFACAASALVKAYYHLQSSAPHIVGDLTALREEIFVDEPLRAFLQNLRNGFSHSQLFKTEPSYTVTHGKTRTVSTDLQFNKYVLLKSEWSSAARTFIDRSETLDVMQIVSSYFLQAKRFFDAYPSRTGIIHDPLFKDFARIKQAQTVTSYEVSLGLVLQHTQNKPLDPYKFLSRYLTRDEMERVACLQDHTKEQVDYIISLRDPLGLCSAQTRHKLYRVFGVSSAE